MRKHIFICLFFFSGLISAQEVPLPSANISSKPDWAHMNPSAELFGDTPYFIGISRVFLVGGDGEKKAKEEACDAAIQDVAKYFGVSVSVTTESHMTDNSGMSISRAEQKSTVSTELSLFQLKPDGIYFESLKEGKYVRGHCLVKLPDEAKQKIQAEIGKNQALYEQALEEFQALLIARDVERAEISAAMIKGLPMISRDERFSHLLTQLEALKEKETKVFLTLDKDKFKMGDELGFQLSTNRPVYYYVLWQRYEGWEMLFPNPAQRFNRGDANAQVVVPTRQMFNQNYIPFIDEEQARLKSIKLWLIASEESLALAKYSTNDGWYDQLPAEGKWLTTVNQCLAEKRCWELEEQVEIFDPLAGLAFWVSSEEEEASLGRTLSLQLEKSGLKSQQKSAEIYMRLSSSENMEYSRRLNLELLTVTLSMELRDADDNIIDTLEVRKQVVQDRDVNLYKSRMLGGLQKKLKKALLEYRVQLTRD